ncbi:Trp biosynthesis-associated membrane protein [Microbacterium sp. W1N]|uniref:Trp biosynthesis-associated membrane protein n=1 Tax=Microbacterium festucae TaxID=2977531 RepID=UPI0021C0D026|nr:Trp biosynthesis-associated membrane protein [Microbacterium festucae]MCT9820215.1 Trp biosynthesis-associated membrane protein [Microbacterium festucae]
MIRRARTLSVLLILLGGALALISSTQTWLSVTLAQGGDEPLAVPGAEAVAMLAPLSLAALALGLALSIVGTVLRYVFGVLALAIGVTVVVASLRIAVEVPVGAVAAAVTTATGLSGDATIARLVATITETPWPAVTVGAGALVIVGGVFTLATAHRWRGAGRRYRTDAGTTGPGARPHDAIDSWDDLSRGDDPTAR